MTLTDPVSWSLLRAIIVATAAIIVWQPLKQTFFNADRLRTRTRWLAILVVSPLLMPDLLLGYTYRLTAGNFEFSSAATEFVYSFLLLGKMIAILLVCHWLVPGSPVSRSAIHLWKQATPNTLPNRLSLLRLMIAGPQRAIAVGWCLSVLWGFQEFETAALMQIEQHPVSWSVWLFDVKGANTPLNECLWLATNGLLVQSLLIASCCVLLKNSPTSTASETELDRSSAGRLRVTASMVVLAGIFLTVVCGPSLFYLTSGLQGLTGLDQSGQLFPRLKQIVWSTVIAGLSAGGSWQLAGWLLQIRSTWVIWLAIVPGLLSPLLLSLLLLKVFQWHVFQSLYDSLLPLIAGQTLWLLPRAVLLCVVVDRFFPSEQIHSARLLQRSEIPRIRRQAAALRWILERRSSWLSVSALLLFAFWEVTISSILHPVSVTPIVCRLYSEMHWGHSEILVALTGLSVGIPMLTLSIVAGLWKMADHARTI